jgi:hypothetical protein
MDTTQQNLPVEALRNPVVDSDHGIARSARSPSAAQRRRDSLSACGGKLLPEQHIFGLNL